jgi:ketosteroid isomerase-like protein
MRMLSYVCSIFASCLIAFGAISPAAVQAAPQDDVRAAVQRFVDSMNRGDFDGASSQCATATIVDQLSPYVFTGPDGCRRWLRTITAYVVSSGITNVNATLDAPTSIDVSDTAAYVVYPITFAVAVKGERVTKNAVATIVLARGPDGWKLMHVTFSRPGLAT